MTFLSRILALVSHFFLDWLYARIAKLIVEWRAKKEDEKKVEDAKDKIVNGDLKKGLEGTEELEDHINRNA